MLLNNKYDYNPKTDLLGEGGFGRVYKARDRLLGRDVALKIVHIEGAKTYYNLLEEIKKVYDLSHPNIIRYLDVFELHTPTATGEDMKTQVGVMEYIPHGDISMLDWSGLSPEEQKDVLIQILDGLGFLHQHRIIHRDIKPSNILIRREGNRIIPKITDFGISKLQDATSVGVSRLIGSIPFMAPEQFDNQGRVSFSTDLWSFGVLVYYLFTGNMPFGDEETTSDGAIMKNIVEMPLPKEVSLIPYPFRELVKRCLVKDRTERVNSALLLRVVLNDKYDMQPPHLYEKDVEPDNYSVEKTDESDSTSDEPVVAATPERSSRAFIFLWLLVFLGVMTGLVFIGNREKKRQLIERERLRQEAFNRATANYAQSHDASSIGNDQLFQNEHNDGQSLQMTGQEEYLISASVYDSQFEYKLVFVHGGEFTMGCTSEQRRDCFQNESPAHMVTLSDYYIGKYPVTQEQWWQVMGNNPSYFDGCDDCPVESVSWYDIQEFIRKLNQQSGKNYRLPTEAEWEYAARGGRQSRGYKFSGSNFIDDVAWHDNTSVNMTHPVGIKNANELDIYDMSGNVWEWCHDWYDSYSRRQKTNPKGPSSGSYRVLRGGCWVSNDMLCRVSTRYYGSPAISSYYYGFRLALSE